MQFTLTHGDREITMIRQSKKHQFGHRDKRGMQNLANNLSHYRWENEFEDAFKGRRVLVTGATGFVGTQLCEALVSLGAQVYGIALETETSSKTRGVCLSSIDLSCFEATQNAVNDIQPDLVYHLAALVNTNQDISFVHPTLQHNLVGSINLMVSLAGKPCQRTILTTSSETPLPGCPPNSPYAASKLAIAAYANMFHQLYNFPVVLARPHMSYGPRQLTKKLIPYIITSILSNTPPLLSSGKRILDMVYIKDLVRGLLLVGIKDHVEGITFDIGTGKGISIKDIVQNIQALMPTTCPAIFNALPDRTDDFAQIASPYNAQSILGWHPIWSLEAGLKETIQWYRKEFDVLEPRQEAKI
jgi:UDP-glucose 4-epimerase